MKRRRAAFRKPDAALAAPSPATAAVRKVAVSAEVRLDPRNPIPFEYGGFGMALSSNGFYLPFLDEQDNYFAKLLELRTLSVVHNACINTKTDYVIGGGLRVTNLKEGEAVDPDFEAFLDNANGSQVRLDAVLRSVCDAFLGFGNAPVEIVRGAFGGQKFVYIHAHETMECRLEKANSEGVVERMVYSPNFRRRGLLTDAGAALFIPLWRKTLLDKVWRKDGAVERTALWFKNKVSGYKYYGMPSAVSSIHNQKVEHDAVRYNLDNLENNMVVGGVVVLSGNVTQDEANKIGRKIIAQHTGAGKQGRVAVMASEQGIENSKFLSFDTQKEGSYNELDDKATEKIILANQWNAVLAGISDRSTLGNGKGYLEAIYQEKMATVIGPLQQRLLREVVKPLLAICDEWMGTKWSDYKLEFEELPIVNQAASELATSADGIRVTLEVAKAVHEGYYTREAAVKLLSTRFHISEQQASELLP